MSLLGPSQRFVESKDLLQSLQWKQRLCQTWPLLIICSAAYTAKPHRGQPPFSGFFPCKGLPSPLLSKVIQFRIQKQKYKSIKHLLYWYRFTVGGQSWGVSITEALWSISLAIAGTAENFTIWSVTCQNRV